LLEQAGIDGATDQPHLGSTIPSFLTPVLLLKSPLQPPSYLSSILSL
jgi:hypothetical protein